MFFIEKDDGTHLNIPGTNLARYFRSEKDALAFLKPNWKIHSRLSPSLKDKMEKVFEAQTALLKNEN